MLVICRDGVKSCCDDLRLLVNASTETSLGKPGVLRYWATNLFLIEKLGWVIMT
jgi:hypothetical protein